MNTPPAEPGQADILIVDDVPDNIRFLSNFLVAQGYQVRKALNGQMALTAIKTLAPDLILLDIGLPDLSGYEICRQVKADPSTCSIPIIFLSAGNEATDKVKAFQLGASDYVTKPFYLEEVLVRIQTHLTIQALQKESKAQNQKLQQALDELKIAQANLVQQEKMATLKKVVAGVCHEVNNPLSFIACNIKPAQSYISQLLSLIELYQQHCNSTDPNIQAFLEDIDLDFVSADLKNILQSMGKGTERIHTVVMALKIFTHLDESGKKSIDLHQSIDQVLALLQHRLVSKNDDPIIPVKKEYENLPAITCYADQINQVIFNLLDNAIDAIHEKLVQNNAQQFHPQISIYTHLTHPDSITICIRDNGIGISPTHQPYIFEPFFTTKSAGHGVGLGLATSRRIVEEMHGGSLQYTSSSEGTDFVIRFPLAGVVAPIRN